MAYELYAGDDEDQQSKVAYCMRLFETARLQRINFEPQWEESSAIIWPEYRGSFTYGHVRAPGVKYTQYQVESTGSISATRFMAIADYAMTPFAMMWSAVGADNDYLMKQRGAQEYFDACTQAHWSYRYRPEANFPDQQQTNWHSLGVFGSQYMLIDQLDTRPGGYAPGLRYIAPSIGEIYLLVNHQGRVDGYIRIFRWTARQASQRWPDTISQELAIKMKGADEFTLHNFFEFVLPRSDFDPLAVFSRRGKPWSSTYLSLDGKCILEEGGYYSFPLAAGRYSLAPEEWYGRGWAQQVLPDLKSKNTITEAYLRNAMEGGDPYRLVADEGLFDFRGTNGNWVVGGINDEGKPMVQNLAAGNLEYSEKAMAEFDKRILAASLNDLYREIFDKDNQPRSAREVVEAINSRNIFLGPLAKQFGYLGDIIRRERVVLRELGLYPKMPPVVREAQGGFKEMYMSPLGRALEAQPIAGFMRTAEMLGQLHSLTGDDSLFDPLDFDTATPEIARSQFVPVRWTATPQMIARKQQARAKAQQQQQYIQSLPGLAARDKAQAITAKAQVGQNIGGTLSGTPQGGMPAIPGNPPGLPGRAGFGGRPGMPGQPAPGP